MSRKLSLAQVLGHEASDKRIDILRRIAQAGSISQAARAAGVSYKAAWQALETLTNLAGTPLLEKAVGGPGGGGALLTQAGQDVLRAADELARARQQVLAGLQGRANAGRAALALRTSMRNQFPCTVGTLRPWQGQARVQLLLSDGAALQARITRDSAQLLGLRKGMAVLALCKATAVRVAASPHQLEAGEVWQKPGTGKLPPDIDPIALRKEGPALNLLEGLITRGASASRASEVTLQLRSGVQLVGFSAPGQALKKGSTAFAALDESSVVIGATH